MVATMSVTSRISSSRAATRNISTATREPTTSPRASTSRDPDQPVQSQTISQAIAAAGATATMQPDAVPDQGLAVQIRQLAA